MINLILIAKKPFCEISRRDELLYISFRRLERLLCSLVTGSKIQGHSKAYHRNRNLDSARNMLISNAVSQYSFGTGLNEAVFFRRPVSSVSSKVVFGEMITPTHK